MFVACSTLCFSKQTLGQALRTIHELQFTKVDLALHEQGTHLKPSVVVANLAQVASSLRAYSHLSFGAFHVHIEADRFSEYTRQLRSICRLGRALLVPLVTIPAAPLGSDLLAEVDRLSELVRVARSEGLLLTVETHRDQLTADPLGAAELCRRVQGLGLTLDPSHYMVNGTHIRNWDSIYPFVRHVRLRDSGNKPEQWQVPVGQGSLDFGRIITQLSRCRYDRLLSVDIRDDPTPNYPIVPEVRKLKYLMESLV